MTGHRGVSGMILKSTLFCFILFLFVGCGNKFSDEKPIVKVGNDTIYEAELYQAIQKLSQKKRIEIVKSPEKKKDFLDKIVKKRVKAIAAQSLYPKQIDVFNNLMENQRESNLVKGYSSNVVYQNLGFSESTIRRFYHTHAELFTLPYEISKTDIVKELIKETLDPQRYYDSIVNSGMKLPSLESVKVKLIQHHYTVYREGYISHYFDSLKTERQISNVAFKPVGLEEFYEKNAAQYMTKKSFRLLHIQYNDKEELNRLHKSIRSVKEFENNAESKSINALSSAKKGHIGYVKQHHCLPYGIGMQYSLFTALDTAALGMVPGIYNDTESGKFHIFYLTEKRDAQQKPFDRVKKYVEANMPESEKFQYNDSDAVVMSKDRPLLFEHEVKKYRKSLSPKHNSQLIRSKVLSHLAQQKLLLIEAEKVEYIKSKEYSWHSRSTADQFWARTFDQQFANTFGLDTTVLKKVHKKHAALFGGDFEKSIRDVALFHKIQKMAYFREYFKAPHKYPTFLREMEKGVILSKMFRTIRWREKSKIIDREVALLMIKFGVTYLDPDLTTKRTFGESIGEVHSLIAKKGFKKARSIIDGLMITAEVENKVDSLLFVKAQLLTNQKQYNNAVLEYRLIEYLFPKSILNEKSLFLRAVALYDTQKYSDAKADFEKLKVVFPKSQYVDDSDAMLREIQSKKMRAPAKVSP